MTLNAAYPTAQHSDAASVITAFFAHNYDIESVLLLNSCARGKATRDSCLDIAVLAREGPAVGRHQVGRVVEKRAESGDPLFRLQVEVRPRVNAAITEMAVEIAAVAVALEELPQIAQVAAVFRRRDRCILPPFSHDGPARHMRRGTET